MYIVKKIKDESETEWQNLIKASKQSTPFHREKYLQAVGFHGERYIVKKKDRLIVGLVLAIDSNNMVSLPPFAPHQGLLFNESGDAYRVQKEQLEAVTILLEELDKEYSHIVFVNHFSVIDMRACLWHHYHEPEKGMYTVTPMYTAIKQLIDSDGEMERNLSKGRRQDYKYSTERYGLRYEKSDDYSRCLELYKLTFARQEIHLTEVEMNSVERIIAATSRELGFLRYAVDLDGNKIDAIYILVEGDTAYYLFGANHPDYRKYGGGTFLLVEAMKECASMGVKYFDFVGVNSPYRGDFKLN